MIRYDCEKLYEYDEQEEIRYRTAAADSKINVTDWYLCCGLDKGSLIFLSLLNGKITEIHSRLTIAPKPITFIIDTG